MSNTFNHKYYLFLASAVNAQLELILPVIKYNYRIHDICVTVRLMNQQGLNHLI